MTTKLTIANGAMRLLRERALTQNELTNGSREPARIFNDIWADGGLNACLEAGQWKFAKRTVMLDATTDMEGDFGYANVFEKPEDFVRVIGIWSDEMLRTPLEDYREEGGFWYASLETIFVSYVSNDASFGGDYSLWPQSFVKFVHAHFAAEVAGPLADKGDELMKVRKMFLSAALSTDAMADPTRYPPAGSWVRARMGGGARREG
jgi:hypothetical protein